MEHLDLWLGLVGQAAKFDAGFALEVAECARLIKGYGDTHARGSANFAKIVETVITPVLSAAAAGTGGLNAAASLAAAREAALADPEGQALDEALAADCGLQLAG